MAGVIIEGFDMIGKGALLDLCHRGIENSVIYRPSYDEIFDKILTRKNAYIIGLSISDFMVNVKSDLTVLFDRQLPSSVVYDKLLGNNVLTEDIINKYIEINKRSGMRYSYLNHSSKTSAKLIYNYVQNNRKLEELDMFDSFDDYWDKYLMYDEEFSNFFHEYGVDRKKYESVSNSDGSRVDIRYIYTEVNH